MQSLHPEKKWQLSESMRERNKKMPLSLEKKSECWYKMLMEWAMQLLWQQQEQRLEWKMMKVLILEWNGLIQKIFPMSGMLIICMIKN